VAGLLERSIESLGCEERAFLAARGLAPPADGCGVAP
jgi:hypothetical protein